MAWRYSLLLIGRDRLQSLSFRVWLPEPLGQPGEKEIDHRRRIKRQSLAKDQAADHRDAQRMPQFRTYASAERKRKAAQQGRHGGHHDRTKAQQTGLIDRLLGGHAVLALGV